MPFIQAMNNFKRYSLLSKSITCALALTLLTTSPTVYAQIEECYSPKFGLSYASDMSRYVNVSNTPLDMNEDLQGLKLEQKDAYFKVLNQVNTALFDKLYDIVVYSDGYVLAKKDGKFGLIDNKGKLIHDFKYEVIDRLNDEQAILSTYKNSRLSDALVNEKGQWIYPKSKNLDTQNTFDITAVYYDSDKQQGYFQVSYQGVLGLIDAKGETIIPMIYDEMESLDHCARGEFVLKVRRDQRLGLLNYSNKFIVPLRAKQSISTFSTIGYKPFILNIKSASQGVVDTLYWRPNKADVLKETLISANGEVLLTSDSTIDSVGGNLYRFSKDGKFGIINDWAEIILGTYYDNIDYEYDSPLIAERAGKFGIINTDQSGNMLKVHHYFDSLERVRNESVILDFLRSLRADDADDVIVIDESSILTNEIDSSSLVDQDDIEYVSSTSIENDYYDSRSPQAYIASYNNKYGVISSYNSDELIIPFDYDAIKEIGEVFIVEQSGKYGVLDLQGNIIQPLAFDAIQDSDNGFLILVKKEQQALMSMTGEMMLPLSDIKLRLDMMEYARAPIPIERNGLFGYLNKARDNIAIEPSYETIELIYDSDNFMGQNKGKKRIIKADNTIVKVRGASDYHIIATSVARDETAFISAQAGQQGMINADGKVLLPFDYEAITSVLTRHYDSQNDSYDYSRVFIVKQNGLFGLLDSNLKVVVSPTYRYFDRLNSQPYFVIASDSKKLMKYGLVDTKGNLIKPIEYDAIFVNPEYDGHLILKNDSTIQYYNEEIALRLEDEVVIVEDAL